jgi:hypothetical protein
MPLAKPEDFGTDPAGFRINDYCTHCYRNGAFTKPGATLAQMIDDGVGIMVLRGIMPEAKARALLSEVMPHLKRWQRREPREALQGVGGRGFLAGDEQC